MSEVEKVVRLASGAQLSLEGVSDCLTMLSFALEGLDTRDLAYQLRQLCFGQDVSPEARARLGEVGLLEGDGSLSPVMKETVLSAIRGEGYALYLASPFTTTLDRALHEFRSAPDLIRSELTEDEAEKLVGKTNSLYKLFQKAKEELEERGEDWRSLLIRSRGKDNPGQAPSPE